MVYKIDSIEMEGIRGINKPVRMVFDEELTVIHGPNGSGKSSILQAIEWGLLGEIPYMRRGDFAKEDAIVNAFTRNKRAKVTLTFKGPQEIKLTRSKNRTRSTTSGKQSLVLHADQSYEDDNAEEYLENNLKLDMEEASRSKFLHQETIRDALTYSPTERSAVIEKLLGTFDIKEFTKALDQKRRFNSEIKDIEGRQSALERDQIQFILNLRRNLDELMDSLLKKGYGDHQLDLAWSLNELEGIRKSLDGITESIKGTTIVHPEISASIESLLSANKRASEDITVLDRKRMEEIRTRTEQITIIDMLNNNYENALVLLKEYETLDIEELTNQRNETDQLKTEATEIFENTLRISTLVPSRIASYDSVYKNLEAEKEKLKNEIDEFGDETSLKEKISKSNEKLGDISQELNKYSGQNRIVNLAAELIEATKSDNCPVCGQTINPTTLVNELKSKVTTEISIKISDLTEAQRKENLSITESNQRIERMETHDAAIKTYEEGLDKAKGSLEELIGEITDETDLAMLLDEIETKVQEERAKLTELETMFRELDDKIRQYTHLNNEVSENRKKLQKELGQIVDGKALIEAAKQQLEILRKENAQFEDTTGIDVLIKRVGELNEILGFLEDKERTENAEKELPALEEQKNTLEERKTGLLLLSGALSSISDIVTQYQKETSLQQILDLEEMMNETFQAILGHPYYTRLKIDIEKEDPLQFSFRAASERESTYIPTRFSTAQLNIAALSIFVSNSKLMAGDLPLITFDDPTQNMDDEHKKAFAELISNLTKDFQVIIATEDDETKEYLKQECPNGKYHEIQSWDTEGPIIS